MNKVLFIILTLLLSCTTGNVTRSAADDNDIVIVKEEHTARQPFSKEIMYTLCNEEGEDNLFITAQFFKNKIKTMFIGIRNKGRQYYTDKDIDNSDNDTMAVDYGYVNIPERKSYFKIPYQGQKEFLKKVTYTLNCEYGLSDLGQVFTYTDIWGDASVDISQKYAKQNLVGAISGSELYNDINKILSSYGLVIDYVWSDKPSFITKELFLKKNITLQKHLPDQFVNTGIVFELKKKN